MTITVDQALHTLLERGAIRQSPRIQSAMLIEHVEQLTGRSASSDLRTFYGRQISGVADFAGVIPKWNSYTGWEKRGWKLDMLLHVQAIPLFGDGCGSVFGVDISADTDHPAVYFFDHQGMYEKANYAAGSSIGAFLLLLAEHDDAIDEHRPPGWELEIDPDIDKCPRAPPIWLAE